MKAIELFQLNIQRAEELLKIHQESFPKGRPVAEGPAADLLRAVIVFTMAALDAYIHRRAVESVRKIMVLKKRVPEKCVEIISNRFKEKGGYREILNLAIQKDPQNKILHLLEESLSPMTFQKPGQLESYFNMAELKEPWEQINKLIQTKPGRKKKGRKKEARGILLLSAERRDDIVHKNDMYISKKYHGKIKSISRKDTRDDLKELRRIVLAIEKISED